MFMKNENVIIAQNISEIPNEYLTGDYHLVLFEDHNGVENLALNYNFNNIFLNFHMSKTKVYTSEPEYKENKYHVNSSINIENRLSRNYLFLKDKLIDGKEYEFDFDVHYLYDEYGDEMIKSQIKSLITEEKNDFIFNSSKNNSVYNFYNLKIDDQNSLLSLIITEVQEDSYYYSSKKYFILYNKFNETYVQLLFSNKDFIFVFNALKTIFELQYSYIYDKFKDLIHLSEFTISKYLRESNEGQISIKRNIMYNLYESNFRKNNIEKIFEPIYREKDLEIYVGCHGFYSNDPIVMYKNKLLLYVTNEDEKMISNRANLIFNFLITKNQTGINPLDGNLYLKGEVDVNLKNNNIVKYYKNDDGLLYRDINLKNRQNNLRLFVYENNLFVEIVIDTMSTKSKEKFDKYEEQIRKLRLERDVYWWDKQSTKFGINPYNGHLYHNDKKAESTMENANVYYIDSTGLKLAQNNYSTSHSNSWDYYININSYYVSSWVELREENIIKLELDENHKTLLKLIQ